VRDHGRQVASRAPRAFAALLWPQMEEPTKAAADGNDAPQVEAEPAAGADMVLDIDSGDELEEMSKQKFDLGDELDDEIHPQDDDDMCIVDTELLSKEAQPYPALHTLEEKEPEGRKAKVFAKYQQEAVQALKSGNVTVAIEQYTEAMRIGGATPVLLAHRAALLLKQKRPCAAIRDCSAAIKVNPHILQAFRIRGIAHRKLAHWNKAHRDLSEAQNAMWDKGTAEVHKFVTDKLGIKAPEQKKESPAKPKPSPLPAGVSAEALLAAMTPRLQRNANPYANPVDAPPKELDKDQAVFICGLQKAPHLNGKRGVVQRADPRPASRGRWEVEVRLDAGGTEVKSLQSQNIMTLNKADKIACRGWMREEKKHLQEVKKREEGEAAQWSAKRLDAKMSKLALQGQVRGLLRQLKIDDALELLDKAMEPDVKNANSFLATQVRMKLGSVDSSSDEGGAAETDEADPERLPEDKPPFPVVPYNPESGEPSAAQVQATNAAKGKAVKALAKNDLGAALKYYTEAVNAGGAAALMLAKRGEVLLKMKRPNAAIHDSTAAIEVNPDCSKAYHVRGVAHRKLGHWEDANDDLSQGQKLDFDDEIAKVHNVVALKVNSLQERGVKRRKTVS